MERASLMFETLKTANLRIVVVVFVLVLDSVELLLVELVH
mgnify:CR=1 FL=1